MLILVDEITQNQEGSRFPQTLSVYRCSNVVCQAEKDKQKEKRLKFAKEKALADQKRIEERNKRNLKKIL